MSDYMNYTGASPTFNPMEGFQLQPWGASASSLGEGIASVGDASNLSQLTNLSGVNNVTAPGGGGGLFSNFFQNKDANGMTSGGWGTAAIGVAQSLGNAYMGMKQYGLAKDQLALSKRAFETNYAAQKSQTNASLEDRQRARVASNAGAYQSVGEYMAQNKVQ